MSNNKWLTPDAATSTLTQYQISWPDDRNFRALLMGAILLLSSPDNWEQYGASTPDEMAAFWFDYMQIIYSEV